jgi:tRNA-specific 2-thiouridylase
MAKVLVGLSGGVDSAVTAALLKRQGHEVYGYTLKLLEATSEDSEGCCTFKDIRDARMVCDKMGIEFLVTNWKAHFKKNIIDRYVQGIKDGVTYNPCVSCNSTVKMPVLVAVANHFGCDYVATGHYARVQNGRIARGKNGKKDQSYFLWETPTHLVSRFLFPLGDFDSKDDTRSLAREFGLHVAEKRDSTDLCFFEGGTKDQFLARNGVDSVPGSFVDTDGKNLGTHTGHTNYVPGQRAGIGGGQRRYVLKVIPATNQVVVGSHADVLTNKVILRDTRIDFADDLTGVTAVLRYHSSPVTVEAIRPLGDRLEVSLGASVFGAAPGQSCVFYHGDEVVGGGVIA